MLAVALHLVNDVIRCHDPANQDGRQQGNERHHDAVADVDLNKAVNQIEIFDTGVALLAGAMIIPAVYVFSGTEGMSAGPSLMFVSLPKVFAAMGKAGTFVGILFFVTAIFAARYGNRHRLPTPTALPAAARTNPICPEKLLAFFSMILKLLSVFPFVI